MTKTCTDAQRTANYSDCEDVQPWHIILASITLTFMILVSGMITICAYLVWKYRHLTLIKFRSPISIISWSVFANVYHFSRFLYSGFLFQWWDYSFGFSLATYFIRLVGLNGVLVCYVIRAWKYYVVYKHDQVMLIENAAQRNRHWTMRYSAYLCSDTFMMKCAFAYSVIVSCILTGIYGAYHSTHDFSTIHNGVTFLLIFMLLLLLPKQHDQLGIIRELYIFFVVAIFAIVGATFISLRFTNTTERVLTWIGAVILNASCTIVTFYIPFIHYKQIDHVLGRAKKERYEQNNVALARCLASERGYLLFRKFLATIYCQENLDFFVLVQIYRQNLRKPTEDTAFPTIIQQSNRMSLSELPVKVLSPVSKFSMQLAQSLSTKKGGHDNGDENKMSKNVSTVVEKVSEVVSNIRLKTQMSGASNLDASVDPAALDEIVVTESDGSVRVDTSKMHFSWVQVPEILLELPSRRWANWIYDTYVDRRAPLSINITQEMRDEVYRKIYNDNAGTQSPSSTSIELGEVEKGYQKLTKDEPKTSDAATLIKNAALTSQNVTLQQVFDRAQKDCWNLMVRDSFLHFTTSPEYEQYKKFKI